MSEDILTTKQAAAFLGVALSTMYELIRTGQAPPHRKVGNRARFSKRALLEWLEQPAGTETHR